MARSVRMWMVRMVWMMRVMRVRRVRVVRVVRVMWVVHVSADPLAAEKPATLGSSVSILMAMVV